MGNEFFIFAGWLLAVMISVTAAHPMAKARKRDAEGWVLLAAFVGPLAPLALRLLGEATPQTPEQKQRVARVSIGLSSTLGLLLFLVLAIPFFRACFRL